MKQIINFKGLSAITSTENCRIAQTPGGHHIGSQVTGILHDISYNISYEINLDENWRVTAFSISGCVGWKEFIMEMKKENDRWAGLQGELAEFGGCIDIDISVTPFTNSLPVNRLAFAMGQPEKISVVYIDVLKQQVHKIDQVYTKLSAHTYRYENLSNDFSAEITVDDNGFVIEYPGIFSRI